MTARANAQPSGGDGAVGGVRCPGSRTLTSSHRGVISADDRGRVRIDNESQCLDCGQWVPSKGYMPPPEPGRMWQVQEHDR